MKAVAGRSSFEPIEIPNVGKGERFAPEPPPGGASVVKYSAKFVPCVAGAGSASIRLFVLVVILTAASISLAVTEAVRAAGV